MRIEEAIAVACSDDVNDPNGPNGPNATVQVVHSVTSVAAVDVLVAGQSALTNVPWSHTGTTGMAAGLQRHLAWTGWLRQEAPPWSWRHVSLPDYTFSLDAQSPEWKTPRLLGHMQREAWRWQLHSREAARPHTRRVPSAHRR